MVPTATVVPTVPDADTHPRLMVITSWSLDVAEHPEIVYVHVRAACPDGVNGGWQLVWLAFGSNPLPDSELTIAVTTGCRESGLVGVEVEADAMSLIG